MLTDFPPRCWAEINLRALKENVAAIRRGLPPGACYISVVKADGYGLGARRVVESLQDEGVDMFAVANVTEGAELRELDDNMPILILGATLPDELDPVFEYKLTPTISTLEEVIHYQKAAEVRRQPLPVHLKFDTGMGRLGIWHASAEELLKAVSSASWLRIRGLYSHLASAGEDEDFTTIQRDRFCAILRALPPTPAPLLIHIGNSSALACLPPQPPVNAIRVGLLQFGVLPAPDSALAKFNVSPVLSLHCRVSVVKTLPAGTSISYGRTHCLERESRVAILTTGYADGISRACSNRGSVLIHGRRCRILGNVTMDEIVVDVTDLPDVACGARCTLIGQQDGGEISINEYADWSNTIPWESLCALGKRVHRVYL